MCYPHNGVTENKGRTLANQTKPVNIENGCNKFVSIGRNKTPTYSSSYFSVIIHEILSALEIYMSTQIDGVKEIVSTTNEVDNSC